MNKEIAMDEEFYNDIVTILRAVKKEQGMRFWDMTYVPLYTIIEELGELFVEKDGKFGRKRFEEEIWRD